MIQQLNPEEIEGMRLAGRVGLISNTNQFRGGKRNQYRLLIPSPLWAKYEATPMVSFYMIAKSFWNLASWHGPR